MSKMSSPSTAIKQRARELGFDLVGITTADPPPHLPAFQDWLARGDHGAMTYLERRAADRADLQRLLPGVKSVIVVGLNYHTGPAHGIACYAHGSRDYHDLLGDKLRQLAAFLTGLGGAAKWYVDTGPILERDLAQRAGIGFIGKHTNLISRALGNWFFLGEILTTLDLPPDRPEKEYCGTCTRCLTACPTGAIPAPYRLDARRCISYLTIELKGSIPVELRPLIGERIFGCDDCLEVCPWNRFAQQSPIREFQRRPLPPLTEMLAWDETRFRNFFRGTPIYRLKRRGFLRNVCVALANRGDRAALPALERARQDAEPLVREHAAWACDRLQNNSERP